MYLADHDKNLIPVHDIDEMLAHLRSKRRGVYGAFILWHGTTGEWHGEAGPSLLVHINNDLAFLYFLPDHNGEHPGFEPTGMSPPDCPASVHFMQTDGIEEAGLTISRDCVISTDRAYKAAAEFFKDPVLPACIRWFEL
jgi:hypothetical protein